jgi:hypothetical protein
MKNFTSFNFRKTNSCLMGIRNLFVTVLFLSVVITGFSPKDANAVVFGVRPNTAFNPAVPTIEAYIEVLWIPAGTPKVLTMPGWGVNGANSVTWNSDDLLYYAIIQDTITGARHLATVDPLTGICAEIGVLPGNMASLTYNSDLGILYGMSGSGGPSPETLYSINISTAAVTSHGSFPLGTGFGEIIAYNFDDMMIYHWTDGAMEMIDPVTFLATPVAMSGVSMSEPQGAVYLGGGSFSVTDFNFSANTFKGYVVSMAGVVSFPVALPYQLRGLGFYNSLLPVELSSFVSAVSGRDVTLSWSTASETNNSGFDIERSSANGSWTKVGNVSGNGTTTSPQSYTFADRGLSAGTYSYRLKQIDFNGNFEYFELSNEVNIGVPSNFSLSQNYPNPFNPSTKINFDLPVDGNVSIKIFDMSGKEVMTLVNEARTAGYYSVSFNGASLSSGIYFYTIQSGSFVSTKKMTLIK